MADQADGHSGVAADPRLLTASEVADLLRVSRSCVYKLSRLGQLPGIRVTQGTTRSQRRWRKSDVLAYLERHAVGTGR